MPEFEASVPVKASLSQNIDYLLQSLLVHHRATAKTAHNSEVCFHTISTIYCTKLSERMLWAFMKLKRRFLKNKTIQIAQIDINAHGLAKSSEKFAELKSITIRSFSSLRNYPKGQLMKFRNPFDKPTYGLRALKAEEIHSRNTSTGLLTSLSHYQKKQQSTPGIKQLAGSFAIKVFCDCYSCLSCSHCNKYGIQNRITYLQHLEQIISKANARNLGNSQ